MLGDRRLDGRCTPSPSRRALRWPAISVRGRRRDRTAFRTSTTVRPAGRCRAAVRWSGGRLIGRPGLRRRRPRPAGLQRMGCKVALQATMRYGPGISGLRGGRTWSQQDRCTPALLGNPRLQSPLDAYEAAPLGWDATDPGPWPMRSVSPVGYGPGNLWRGAACRRRLSRTGGPRVHAGAGRNAEVAAGQS